MNPDPLALARQWADELPDDFARQHAGALRQGRTALVGLRADAVLPQSAAAVRAALGVEAAGDASFAAGALTSRLDDRRDAVSITPVWTGPPSAARSERLTIAVISDLIDQADARLVLASYATIPSPRVVDSLSAAAARGVDITLILERAIDNPEFRSRGEPLPGLRARRFYWPAAVRPPGAALHAKVLVADDRVALVGSANLTGRALENNLECGLLVRGGPLPRALAHHLLTARGLQEVGTAADSPR